MTDRILATGMMLAFCGSRTALEAAIDLAGLRSPRRNLALNVVRTIDGLRMVWSH